MIRLRLTLPLEGVYHPLWAAALSKWASQGWMSPVSTVTVTRWWLGLPSQLEARWAAYFGQRGLAWQYELVRFSGWTPDFRLVLNGVEAYAEVKPVSEFPMDVAQRVLGAGWTSDILILGREPRHAWRHRGDGWTPLDLPA